jgi:hypothetical protein
MMLRQSTPATYVRRFRNLFSIPTSPCATFPLALAQHSRWPLPRHYLMIAGHHITLDLWSLTLILSGM